MAIPFYEIQLTSNNDNLLGIFIALTSAVADFATLERTIIDAKEQGFLHSDDFDAISKKVRLVDKRMALGSRLLTRLVISRSTGCDPQAIRIGRPTRGLKGAQSKKPRWILPDTLPREKYLHHNISHDADVVTLAIGPWPLGIDIMSLDFANIRKSRCSAFMPSDYVNLMKSVFSQKELNWILQSDDRPDQKPPLLGGEVRNFKNVSFWPDIKSKSPSAPHSCITVEDLPLTWAGGSTMGARCDLSDLESGIYQRFCYVWTLKESVVKCLGIGLALDLRRVQFEFTVPDIRCLIDDIPVNVVLRSFVVSKSAVELLLLSICSAVGSIDVGLLGQDSVESVLLAFRECRVSTVGSKFAWREKPGTSTLYVDS